MKNNQYIGLSGTNGSGKDTIANILSSHFGYLFISISDELRDEAKRRQLSEERVNLRAISAEWRRQFGLSVLVDKAVAAYQASSKQYAGLVMSALRNPGEADRIHELNGTVIWVDADPKVRYERIQASQERADRISDQKTFSQFLEEEAAEMDEAERKKDEAALSLQTVKDKADIFITNDFADLSELTDYLTKTLGL